MWWKMHLSHYLFHFQSFCNKYLSEGKVSRCECPCEIWRKGAAISCEEMRVSQRGHNILFSLYPRTPQHPSSVPFREMMLRCYPNTSAKRCVFGHSFFHNQVDNGVFGRPFLPLCPATQVTFWWAGQKWHFLGLGEQRATGRMRALPGQVSGTPHSCYIQRRSQKSNSSPNLFSQLARLIE